MHMLRDPNAVLLPGVASRFAKRLRLAGWLQCAALVPFTAWAAVPAGTGATGVQAPRSAQFVERATVSGRYGTYSPWSPTSPLFAYVDPRGIYVLDIEKPSMEPVLIARGADSDCTWSPDGGWILARTPARGRHAEGAALVVVPAGGGVETVLVDGALISDFVWAADGAIYYWDYTSPKAQKLDPPADWTSARPAKLTARPTLVFEFGTGMPRATLFAAQSPAPTVAIVSVASFPRSVLRADGFPDGRLLVRVMSDTEGGTATNLIVDATGKTQSRVRAAWDDGNFSATSVSANGGFLAGEQAAGGDDVITASKLFLVAADSAWHLPIAGVEWGTDPRLSRFGSYIAYTDLEGNAHVGQLQLR